MPFFVDFCFISQQKNEKFDENALEFFSKLFKNGLAVELGLSSVYSLFSFYHSLVFIEV